MAMDVAKVLSDLRAYKAQLDEAIAIFDRLAHQRGKARTPHWNAVQTPSGEPEAANAWPPRKVNAGPRRASKRKTEGLSRRRNSRATAECRPSNRACESRDPDRLLSCLHEAQRFSFRLSQSRGSRMGQFAAAQVASSRVHRDLGRAHPRPRQVPGRAICSKAAASALAAAIWRPNISPPSSPSAALKPAGDNGTYFQNFTLVGTEPQSTSCR